MDSDPQSDDPSFVAALADQRLLQLADSAFPIGALSHSFGLETLVAAGLLDNARLPEFLRGYIEEAGFLEAVFCRTASHLARENRGRLDTGRWLDLNQRLSARKPSRESRAGSASLGRNFLTTVIALDASPILCEARDAAKQAGALVHHSVAFGLAAGAFAFDEDRAILAFLHQSVASLVSSCQRLMPLGQTEANRILWNLKPVVIAAAVRSATSSVESACSFAPLLDWGAMEHTALPMRLFIS